MGTADNTPVSSQEEKLRALEEVQRAMINILEDFSAERQQLQAVQRATINILEDFGSEKDKLADVQRGTLNILEDFDAERQRLEAVQRATVNILDDFSSEKDKLSDVQRGTLNILDDFHAEKLFLEDSQRALLNILDDWDESEKLARLSEELKAANKELEAFTYSVAHDLRAPLRQIDGFSKILLDEAAPQLDETAQRYLQRVREGAGKMGQLVDAMLGLARLGRHEPHCQVTHLGSLVNEVLADLKPETAGRQIEWRVGRLPCLDCDAALIKIVMVNLLSNAIKFTRTREQAVIEVGEAERDGQPAVFVRDNGVGFNMKYVDKLFGVFQRLHKPQEFEGTGIGLATVQRIIHKHSGRVWTEAALDKGATFYFTLGPTKSEKQGK
jgi:signal transduction histidine kinase